VDMYLEPVVWEPLSQKLVSKTVYVQLTTSTSKG